MPRGTKIEREIKVIKKEPIIEGKIPKCFRSLEGKLNKKVKEKFAAPFIIINRIIAKTIKVQKTIGINNNKIGHLELSNELNIIEVSFFYVFFYRYFRNRKENNFNYYKNQSY